MHLFYLAAAALAAPALGEPIPKVRTSGTKPWIVDYDISEICFPGQLENCLGSMAYCASKGWEANAEPAPYRSPGECLAARTTTDGSPNAAPGGKIPFLEPTGIDCFHAVNAETCKGSAAFCAVSKDEAACLAARSPPPDNLEFREPGQCRLLTEKCLGTKKWCALGSAAEQKKCEQRREAN
ncbi:hypothetical protein IF1G_11325 [Cordyceps javanica]|uniref:Uncharacterized protein n=1 Tax=Cordyceps javanica TaxID=43265 RepID=A0A545UKL2_9HYPO|nr:hypothetical protein IF1G_11325 [Cordyceps javanica]